MPLRRGPADGPPSDGPRGIEPEGSSHTGGSQLPARAPTPAAASAGRAAAEPHTAAGDSPHPDLAGGHDRARPADPDALTDLLVRASGTPSAILWIDARGAAVHALGCWESVTGCGPATWIGPGWIATLAGDAVGTGGRLLVDRLRDALAARAPWETEFDLRGGDGVVRRVRLALAPVPESARGETLRKVALSDRSAPHGARERAAAAERELRELRGELQSARKMVSIGQFATGIAHDFNNLLAAIIGNGDLLRRLIAGRPAELECLDPLLRAADRASAMTRQLLAFGREERRPAVPCDVNALVRELEGLLRRVLGERVELRLQLGPELPRIGVDPIVVERVLLNLATNARDAMPQGGTLLLETACVEWERAPTGESATPAGRHVRITVTDDGPGIAPEHLPRVFDPFFTTKPAGEGTGLGLATVRDAVHRARGFIDVETREGRGTSFRIHLPADPPPLT